MPLSAPPPSRAHLRLASSPSRRPRGDGRVLLRLRALAAMFALALSTIAAWCSTALALAPLLWRRRPVGRRQRAQSTREARIIPFQPRPPRRTALPR